MKTTIAIAVMLLISACAILKKPTEVNLKPISLVEFMDSPFGHDESIKSFTNTLPKGTKTQKLLRHISKNYLPDTIYNFKYKKSKIAVYKTRHNQEFMLGGVVKNPEIETINGLRTGMEKDKFFQAFTDVEKTQSDTINLKHPKKERKFSFYFNRLGRLESFTFSGN
jgi:hypothetical protein